MERAKSDMGNKTMHTKVRAGRSYECIHREATFDKPIRSFKAQQESTGNSPSLGRRKTKAPEAILTYLYYGEARCYCQNNIIYII